MIEFVFWGSFILIAYTYVGYPLILLALNKVKSRPPNETLENHWPSVSIILAAYNEEVAIQQRIENLLDINYPRAQLEILVVSDASTDRTNSIVAEFGSRGVTFIARPTREGKTAALNYGCPRTKGDVLVFTDANGVFEKDALQRLVRHFSDPDVGCVCGAVRYFNLRESAAYQGESCYMGYDSWIKKLESRLGSVIGAFGGLFAFRRQFFEPMDPMLPVDLEIPLRVLRQGYKVLFESSAVCVEPASGRVGKEFARHARINARLFYGMGRWVRGLLRPFYPFILFQFVSKKLLRWVSPFLFFALIGMPFFMDGLVYEYLRIFNVLFLCTAGAAVAFSFLGRSQPLLSFALHLLVGNAAVAWGFVAFLTRRQGPTWSVSRN